MWVEVPVVHRGMICEGKRRLVQTCGTKWRRHAGENQTATMLNGLISWKCSLARAAVLAAGAARACFSRFKNSVRYVWRKSWECPVETAGIGSQTFQHTSSRHHILPILLEKAWECIIHTACCNKWRLIIVVQSSFIKVNLKYGIISDLYFIHSPKYKVPEKQQSKSNKCASPCAGGNFRMVSKLGFGRKEVVVRYSHELFPSSIPELWRLWRKSW